MDWQIDQARQCMVDEHGYMVTTAHIMRGSIEPKPVPVYRAFTPTGGFLGACGEREDAEDLCSQHKDKIK